MSSRTPLFSTYRTGENRVTASMIAVFERVGLDVLERVLGPPLGDPDLALMRFRNQVTDERGSVPDASIAANFMWLFEVKTEAGVSDAALCDQVERHLAGLQGDYASERLIVITPDPEPPAAIGQVGDPRVSWVNFAGLDEAIKTVLDGQDGGDGLNDLDEPIAPQSAFLLRELRRLFAVEGLLDTKDTVVVAAGKAWRAYQAGAAYVCPPDRAFRVGLGYLAFYANGAIQPLIPRILSRHPEVLFTAERAIELREAGQTGLATAIEAFLDLPQERDREDRPWQVFLLTGVEDERTIRLTAPIENTTTTTAGRRWGWTLSQRYTRLDAVRSGVRTTTELEEAEARWRA